MAYCRFGSMEGSDVYLLYNVQGYFECCGCSLNKKMSVEMNTAAEAIGHLNKHVKHGDTVPKYAFERLISDAIEDIIELTKNQEKER